MGLAKQIKENGMYRIVFLAFQLLGTILLSRLTGPSGFGIYSLLVVNGSFLLMLTSLGIPSGMLYHASIRDVPSSSLVRIAWVSTLIQLLLIILAEGVHFYMTGTFLIWRDEHVSAGIWGVVFFLFIVITEKYYALFNGYGKLATYSKIAALFNVLFFAALLIIFLVPQRPATTVAIQLFVAVQVLQFIVLAIVYHNASPVATLAGEKGMTMKLASYSLQSYLANLLFFVFTRVDFWILEYYHGTEKLGIYALPVRIVQLLLILPALVSSVVLPNIASGTLELNTMQRVLRILNTINLLAVLMMLIFSWWLIPLLFGERFSASASVLVLLLPGILFLSVSTLLSAYFAGKRRVRVNIFASLFALLAAGLADLLLIPGLGPAGAAIASSLGSLVCFTYQYMLFRKQEYPSRQLLLMGREDLGWIRAFVKQELPWTRENGK